MERWLQRRRLGALTAVSQGSRAGFLALTSGGLQPPVTSVGGDVTNSGLLGQMHSQAYSPTNTP